MLRENILERNHSKCDITFYSQVAKPFECLVLHNMKTTFDDYTTITQLVK